MGLKLGKLLRNAGTLGTTWMRDQRQAKKKKKKAERLQEQALADAEEFRNRDLGQTAFQGVQADPALVQAQRQSLDQTQQVAQQGYTDVDRQAMNQQLNDVARYEQAQRQTLTDQARARGTSGSGIDMASQLAAQQSGADRAMQTGTDMAIAGRDRAYQATQDAAQQAAAMRGQGFGEQAQVAGATDAYEQWRAGTQGSDFDRLQATRGIQANNLNQQAAGLEQTENLDAAANAVANYYTAGQAGNVAGPSTPPSSGTGGYQTGAGGGAKSMGAAPPTATPPAPGGPTQKGMPGGAHQRPGIMGRMNATGPRTQPSGPRNPAAAVANMVSAGGGGPRPNARRAGQHLMRTRRSRG